MLLLLFVRYLYLFLKLKHEALVRQNVKFTITKLVFNVFCKLD